jgi:hypothetical protein
MVHLPRYRVFSCTVIKCRGTQNTLQRGTMLSKSVQPLIHWGTLIYPLWSVLNRARNKHTAETQAAGL